MYLSTLKKYYGYDNFRGIQLDIIKSIASGHDTLGLMPTGGGKSITFQVPALTMDGVCIVITPLVSLMRDQVMHLKQRGIKAEAIYSALNHQEILTILDNAIYGAIKFLYVSPERLTNQLFISKLYYMKVCFITVDEAHCISQWGYDFRPSYLKISELRKLLPGIPILALTATATPEVIEDIKHQLQFPDSPTALPKKEGAADNSGKAAVGASASPSLSGETGKESAFFKMSFKRNNISYVVRKCGDKDAELLHILNSVPGSAIIYTRNRAKTKQYAEFLKNSGISATYYHAGLDFAIKDTRQEEWHDDKTRVIVATNAFGMGIDKPDVRIVIHLDCPDSIEAYFQEAGRAGRDGRRSYAVLLYNNSDRSLLKKHISHAFPSKDYIRKVYDNLGNFFQVAVDSGEGAVFDFDVTTFCINFKHLPAMMEGALAILQNAGYLTYNLDHETRPRVKFIIRHTDLYDIPFSKLEEAVINNLLRNYGSLFTDLTYIDFKYIATNLKITEEQLHIILKTLAQKRIITYVARRFTPILTFLQQRYLPERLRIPANVYETLREKYINRCSKIIEYAESNRCRQQMLLEYFGEKNTEECQQCDYCLSANHGASSPTPSVMDAVLSLLQDHQPHFLSEIAALGKSLAKIHNSDTKPFGIGDIQSVLAQLRDEERIIMQNSSVILL